MRKIYFWFSALLVLSLYTGCRKAEPDEEFVTTSPTASASAEVPNAWMQLSLDLTKKTPGFAPPVAARAFGYMSIALYESVVEGMPRYQSLTGQLAGYQRSTYIDAAKTYYYPACANAAMAYMATRMYGSANEVDLGKIAALEDAFTRQFESTIDAATLANSKEYGRAVAETIYNWSVTDGGHDGNLNLTPTDFVIPVGEGFWVPTPPAYARPLLPYWGEKRTFLPGIINFSAPAIPMAFAATTNSDFYDAAYEIYDLSKNLTPEQTVIAHFWADAPTTTSTPAGHSMSLLKQILHSKQADLGFAAQAYAKLGIALGDAFVSCWKYKYQYNLMRPVTYIREHIDSTWMPILPTPNFPEFTSGHSVQSGAMAIVLSHLFGNNYAFSDSTHVARTDINGTPRAFTSFDAAAREAALSRLYGGIHYREASEMGLEQGRKIGFKAITLHFLK